MEQLLRQRAESIWTAAIRSVLPDEAVRRALEHFHPQGRVFLVAAGKAVWTPGSSSQNTAMSGGRCPA